MPVRSGKLADAMQWKKTSVFAVAGGDQEEIISWLRKMQEDLDSIKTAVWSTGSGEIARMYLLLGWSNWGADELRRASVDSVIAADGEIRVYVSRPHLLLEGSVMGTADMHFVGWEIPLEKLNPGDYTAQFYLQRDTITVKTQTHSEVRIGSGEYEMVRELKFRIGSTE